MTGRMSTRNIEISFRKGKPIAAYLYLRDPKVRTKSASTSEPEPGIIVDYSNEGAPLGIEIVMPLSISSGRVDEVLKSLGEPALEKAEKEALTTNMLLVRDERETWREQ